MSKKISKILHTVDPIGAKLSDKAGLDPATAAAKDKARDAADAAAAAGAPSAAGVQKARGLEDRQGRIESAAAAAGAVRSENDADVLGADNYTVKKKRASKDLLGS